MIDGFSKWFDAKKIVKKEGKINRMVSNGIEGSKVETIER